jgi:predicted Zn-dependent protease
MLHRSAFSRSVFATSVLAALLAGCGQSVPAPVKPPIKSNVAMVADIQAAGEREKSVIDVHALRDPGITALQEEAQNDMRTGLYDAAAGRLDQAMKLSPTSPDLMQDRAEVAIYQGNYVAAEKLARVSWSLGPGFGPLCARSWQTIVEVRRQANDEAGADAAQKSLAQCHKPGIQRL